MQLHPIQCKYIIIKMFKFIFIIFVINIFTYIFFNFSYLVCENQRKKSKCPVTASISVDMNDNRIKIKRQHNHVPQKVDIPMVLLRKAAGLKEVKPESFSTSVGQLYNQAIIE